MKQNTCTVLIYDAQLINTLALYEFLKPCFQIITAANSKEALVIIEQRNIPLAILSIDLDDKLGQKLLDSAIEYKTNVIEIVTSLRNTSADHHRILLTKPIDYTELLAAIEQAMPCLGQTSTCQCHPYFQQLKTNLSATSPNQTVG